MLLEITYQCRGYDEGMGCWQEGETACRLRVLEDRAVVHPGGRVTLDQRTWGWLEDALAALERLRDREYLPGSICDIRLADLEG